MLKGLLVLGNLMGLFILNLFMVNVTVTQNLPDTMEAGKDYQIQIKVSKEDLSGFAQIKINLPDGMTATADNQSGASFTFKDQVAKFIWMGLPADPEITLNYTISVAADASGDKNVTGKFSYLEDNNPASYIISPKTIKIGAGTTAENPETPENPEIPDNPPVEQNVSVNYTRQITDNGDGTYLVDLDITKENIKDFARLKENIPVGLTATKGKTSGAIFQFIDNTAKFIWTEVPAADNFQVSYNLKADPTMSGDFNIDGEFSYLVNDETQEVVSDPTPIKVNGTTAENPETPENPEIPDTPPGDDANPTCDRQITDLGNDRFKVVVAIDRDGTKGFARMKDLIPAGFTASEGESSGSRFTFEKQEVKFVWTTLPDFTNFTVTYFLEPNTATAGDFDINGEFSYLVDGETEKKACGPTSFTLKPPAVTDVPPPATGVTYKVQICAGKKPVSDKHFSKHYGYNKKIDIENHQGWIKYTASGKFDAYKKARDERETIRGGGFDLPGPFVTAYNEGDRITVQEALLLSNQQWVK